MTTQWRFDLAHSNVGFTVRHLMLSRVHGRFTRWDGELEFDEQNPGSARLEVHVEAASIDTKNEQRDNHLRSADFFETEKFPEIAFASTAVRPAGQGRLAVEGNLTMHGVTKKIVLDVEYAGRVSDPWGGERTGFSARASVNRRDFGLTWNQALEAGGVAVSDRVEITLEIEAIRQAAQQAVAA